MTKIKLLTVLITALVLLAVPAACETKLLMGLFQWPEPNLAEPA